MIPAHRSSASLERLRCALRPLGFLALVACASCVYLSEGFADEIPELLILSPATETKLRQNPVSVRGKIASGDLQEVHLVSSCCKGHLQIIDERFRLPLYLWTDEKSVCKTTLESPPLSASLHLDYDLPAYDLDKLEAELSDIDAMLIEAPEDGALMGLKAATSLKLSGHPVFASLALDRIMPALETLSDPEHTEALLLKTELLVILGHYDEVQPHLSALAASACSKRSSLRVFAERLFLISDLALVQGAPRALALELLTCGNDYFKKLGYLPRRVLKGH